MGLRTQFQIKKIFYIILKYLNYHLFVPFKTPSRKPKRKINSGNSGTVNSTSFQVPGRLKHKQAAQYTHRHQSKLYSTHADTRASCTVHTQTLEQAVQFTCTTNSRCTVHMQTLHQAVQYTCRHQIKLYSTHADTRASCTVHIQTLEQAIQATAHINTILSYFEMQMQESFHKIFAELVVILGNCSKSLVGNVGHKAVKSAILNVNEEAGITVHIKKFYV